MKTSETIKANPSWFDKQVNIFEMSRFGAMSFLLMAQSCFGSIAAMYSLKTGNYILLGICTAVTMGSNGAFIAQSPAKWCLIIFYTSIIANLIILTLTSIF